VNVTTDCAAELAVALGRREDDVQKELRQASALKLFELGRISSGLAAKLAQMTRVEFLFFCGQSGVSIFQQTEDELLSDVRNAMDAAQ
jgi:predicted HTH domain antitoxin